MCLPMKVVILIGKFIAFFSLTNFFFASNVFPWLLAIHTLYMHFCVNHKMNEFYDERKNITIPHTFEKSTNLYGKKITEIKKFHRIVVHSFQANQYISNELCDIHHVNNGNQSIRLFFVCVCSVHSKAISSNITY